jgi:ABC-type glutathione transport system ATPase component
MSGNPISTSDALLEVQDLRVAFGGTEVVHGVSYAVRRGQFVGIIGETGSGKSVTLRGALAMLPRSGRVTGGWSTFEGRSLAGMGRMGMRRLKGERIGFVPQQPWSALNPVLSLEAQFLAVGRSHGRDRAWSRDRAREMLRRVEIREPERVLRGHVGELSGGMAQRVLIAMSLMLSPDLVVADEPTTALDVTVQREVLDLLAGICREDGTGVLLVTHDLGVVSTYCDDVHVMRHGAVVEHGPVRDVFSAPAHAYTRSLVDASVHHLRDDHDLSSTPKEPADA